MQNTFALAVLHAMYTHARASRPPALARLCTLLGASRIDVVRALASLDRQGLADARRARLTLHGLAVAAATHAAAASTHSRSRAIAA